MRDRKNQEINKNNEVGFGMKASFYAHYPYINYILVKEKYPH